MPLSSFDKPNLRLRTISALVLVPVALLAAYFGGYAYASLIFTIAVVGMVEWMQMVASAADKSIKILAVALLLISLIFAVLSSFALGFVCAAVSAVLLYSLVRHGADNPAWIAAGIPYIAFSSLALLYIRGVEDVGQTATFYLLIVVWATDIGAFIVGRIVGGPKLWPAVSPNKTWAGFFGGAAMSVAAGGAFIAAIYPQYTISSMLMAAVLALVAQTGDLFESHVKRRSGVKDSGNIIPGHGGVLDRVDGLLFAASFFVIIMAAAG